jgi:hypothetical protein
MLGKYRGTRIEDRDMQRQNVIRTIPSISLRTGLFALFFSIGAASLGCSLLCNDLARYYRNKQLLITAQQYLDKLKFLNIDYDVLLKQMENDPNLIKRIAPATLGIELEDANTIHPKPTSEQLAAARKVLAKQLSQNQDETPVIPKWLTRSSDPRNRIILFLAGAGLILISFACFAPMRNKIEDQ